MANPVITRFLVRVSSPKNALYNVSIVQQKHNLSRINTEISFLWNTCGTSKSDVTDGQRHETERWIDRQTERQLTKLSLCSVLLCWHHKIWLFYAEGKIHVKWTFHMGVNIVIFMVFPQWYKHWFILAQGKFLRRYLQNTSFPCLQLISIHVFVNTVKI